MNNFSDILVAIESADIVTMDRWKINTVPNKDFPPTDKVITLLDLSQLGPLRYIYIETKSCLSLLWSLVEDQKIALLGTLRTVF